jgi:hypothetical protein
MNARLNTNPAKTEVKILTYRPRTLSAKDYRRSKRHPLFISVFLYLLVFWWPATRAG